MTQHSKIGLRSFLTLSGLTLLSDYPVAQPTTNPSPIGRRLPGTGAFVAGIIIGGLIYLLFTWIGDKISDATGRRRYETLFKRIGLVAWLLVMILFVFIL